MGKNRNVAIIGTGQVKHGIRRDVSQAEMIGNAAWRAMEDAGVNPDEIEAFATGNMQGFGGINQAETWAGDWMGAKDKPVLRITTGGTTGGSVAQGGYYQVASGIYDITLAIGWEKHSDSVEPGASMGLSHVGLADQINYLRYNPNMKSLVGYALGPGAAAGVSCYQAVNYMKRSGAKIRHLDMIAAKDRRNAAKNKYAHLQYPDITEDDIAETETVSYPFRFGHICPASDGASAVVYAEEKTAKEKTDRPAWVTGAAAYSDEDNQLAEGMQGVGISDYSDQMCAKVSAMKAYERAGIKDPREEIDVAEIYQPFPHQEMMYSERIGLFKEGEGWKAAEEGITEIDGDMPIDPSGGVNATNAIGSSAMQRVLESARQIRGTAGDHQVPGDVEKAVAHGWGGSTNYATVTVLEDSL